VVLGDAYKQLAQIENHPFAPNRIVSVRRIVYFYETED